MSVGFPADDLETSVDARQRSSPVRVTSKTSKVSLLSICIFGSVRWGSLCQW